MENAVFTEEQQKVMLLFLLDYFMDSELGKSLITEEIADRLFPKALKLFGDAPLTENIQIITNTFNKLLEEFGV